MIDLTKKFKMFKYIFRVQYTCEKMSLTNNRKTVKEMKHILNTLLFSAVKNIYIIKIM